MQYPHMKFCRLLSELDSEEKARAWIWLAKFDGKEFVCPQCNNEACWHHHKNPEVRECKTGIPAENNLKRALWCAEESNGV